ncbi:MAG: hypothetical protein WGN25_09745 [Candidatus Electrothrix sp. GW3-4]|uniref:hypothetical protein n=1 Tax=Candidatus Electrothrix sp. GW3-4 TaxID=3126740 RepID=UPI0030CA7620
MKKLVMSMIMITLALLSTSAYAVKCDGVTIDKVGVYPFLPDTVSYTIDVTCPDTAGGDWVGSRTFSIAKDAMADGYYATALTLISSGKDAFINTTCAANYCVVKVLAVKSTP